MKTFLALCTLLLLGVEVGYCQGTFVQEGTASYYGQALHGRHTASGERYSKYKLTAAHRTLAFGTRVKITNLKNGKSVIVRINDRGPSSKKRIIDISTAAAKKLGMIRAGTAKVRIERIEIDAAEANDSTLGPINEKRE